MSTYSQRNSHPEYAPFAAKLKAAMLRLNLNNSALARRVWGTTKDGRGARNRDRVGFYLAGTGYPGPENLQRLADALSVPVAELAIERPSKTSKPHQPRSTPTAPSASDQPNKVRLQLAIDVVLTIRVIHDTAR